MQTSKLLALIVFLVSTIAIAAGYLDQLNVDNLRLDGNTISSQNTNGDIVVDQNGTGKTQFVDLTASTLLYLDSSKYLASSSVTLAELGLLSGKTGVLVTESGTHSLTNKTIQGSSNTINLIDANFTIGSNPYIAFDNTGGALNGTTTLTVPHTTGNDETITFFSTTDTVVGRATTDTLTNKTLTSPTLGGTITTPLTASRALVTGASNELAVSATTSTQVGYLSTTTGDVQVNIDAKQARSTLTTKGDLYVATASATVARQAVGSDGQILTADSAQTNGIKWATPASAPSAASEISNLTLTTSVAASALTIAVKTQAGSDPSAGDPVKVGMRDATLTSGLYNQRSITGALSTVISSGSTAGQTNAQPWTLWFYLIDNAGTLELAWSGTLYNENQLISTTAEGGAGAADSITTIYSTTARSSVPFRLVGKLVNTQTTAGTWASAGTKLQVGSFGSLANDGTPTVQKFTSGSGTYITPAGVKYIRLRMVGGGGGGGASATTGSPTAGGNGGDSTFGGCTAAKGTGGQHGTGGGTGAGGAGGAATLGSGWVGTALTGTAGSAGSNQNTIIQSGGPGGNSSLGGGGGAGNSGNAAQAGVTNTGGGGGGAGSALAGAASGSGGGSGAYIDAIYPNPLSSYAYAVGAAGSAGAAGGGNGIAGGAGGIGYIEVTEYYQ